MTNRNNTPKTSVVKVSGMKDTFRTAKGSLVTYGEILANHTAYDVDDLTAEQLAKRAKLAKARKNSRKSSTSRTTPRNSSDLSLIGETSATRQANQRGKATTELVSRVNNEAEGVSPLSLTSSPAPITAKLAGDSEITAPDSIILNEVTTEDEWPTVSIRFDDEDFAPDSLGDLITPQMQQQWQAQAVGATMESAIVESREVAGDSEITVADSTTPILSEWKPLFDWSDYTQTATDQFGNSYRKSANLITVTLANGQQGGGETAEDALNCALNTPFYTQAELAQFGEIAEANGHHALPDSLDGMSRNEIIYAAYTRGLIADRTELARLAPIAPLYEYKLNVWRNEGGIIGTVTPKIGMSVLWGMGGVPATITAITAWGITVWRSGWEDSTTVYHEHLSDLWLTEDEISPDSIKPLEKGSIEWTFDCQGFGSGLFFQCFVGSDGYGEWYKILTERSELIKPRTPGSSHDFPAPDSGLTLGDFVEADEPVASHPYPKRISPDSVTSSVDAGIYTLQCPADSHLANTLESWRISHTAIPTLEAWGFVVAQDLKRDFGFFVTPKILRKKITQTIEKLNSAKLHNTSLELPDDAAFAADPALQVDYLNDLITKLEGLL